jgi:hypothetical protein
VQVTIRRLALLSVTAVLASLLSSPASASELSGWGATREEAFGRLHATRALVESGDLAGAAAAAAELADVTVQPLSTASAQPTMPFGDLVGAVEQADGMVRRAVDLGAVDPADVQRRVAELIRAGHPSAPASRADAAVDQAALYQAALLVAGAIDRALVSDWPPGLASTSATVGCDVLDQHPAVCIGGSGANRYEKDYALQIDLGGDDVYANAAGGADRATNGLAVSVALDLGGNDRYETSVPAATGAKAVQGAGIAGVGMLVDAGGNDVYSAISAKAGSPAQGQGFGSLGFGMLADLGGSDSYRVASLGPSVGFSPAAGQSYAVLGGAVLLDEDGNDTYVLEALPTTSVNQDGAVVPGRPYAQGQGFTGFPAGAVFADGGGDDSVLLHAASGPVSDNETQPVAEPSAGVEGAGYGFLGGASVVLTGGGKTTWTVRAHAQAPFHSLGADADAFGVGELGYGALHDGGGDDVYAVEASAPAIQKTVATAGCGCLGALAQAQGGPVGINAAGFGGGGEGILEDAAGNDRYASVATSEATAAATDERPDPPPGTQTTSVATAGPAEAVSQGIGSLGGAGFLLDHSGNDTYESRTSSIASATSTSTAGTPEDASAESGAAISRAQAVGVTGGYGELRDLGGSDAYRSSNISTATASPPVYEGPGQARSSVQGSVDLLPVQGLETVGGFAWFSDTDGGPTDVLTAEPADPACTGTRGQATWRDCGRELGLGFLG